MGASAGYKLPYISTCAEIYVAANPFYTSMRGVFISVWGFEGGKAIIPHRPRTDHNQNQQP